MTRASIKPDISTEDQRNLVRNLGVERSAEVEPITMGELSGVMESGADPSYASMGEAIRRDLSGRLDADLLETRVTEVGAQIERMPEIRAAGVPEEPGTVYGRVAEPGWSAYEHLADVGFFESVEENLPRFTSEHVAETARELVFADPLQAALDEVGFDDRERIALLMSVVNNKTRLARWVPTNEIPADEVEFDVSIVPPLHQRAIGGGLLWIRDLDRHFWGNEVLITDEILDAAAWHTKAMLGGLYVVLMAAEDVATGEALTDGQLTAALTAGAAIDIISQEELMKDVYYITDDMRAPSERR